MAKLVRYVVTLDYRVEVTIEYESGEGRAWADGVRDYARDVSGIRARVPLAAMDYRIQRAPAREEGEI